MVTAGTAGMMATVRGDWAGMRADFAQFTAKFRTQDLATLDYGAMTNEIMARKWPCSVSQSGLM